MSEARTTPRWGLPDAAFAFLAGLVLSSLFVGVAVVAWGGTEDSLPVQMSGLAGLWLGLAGGSWLVVSRKGSGRPSEDLGLRIEPRRDIPLGLVLGLACQFLLVPAVFLTFRALAPDVDFGDQARDLAGDPGSAAFAVRMVAFVVGAPLVEELFYRGLLLRALDRRLGTAAAVAISSVAFGLSHYQVLDPVAVAALITTLSVFGAVLAWLAVRSGRLGPGLVTHAAFNAATLVAISLSP